MMKTRSAEKVNTESSSMPRGSLYFPTPKIFQSYSYIYYSSVLLVDSSSLGPLDLEFEAVFFFIGLSFYLQRESMKWAVALAQEVSGVNVQ